MLSTLTAREREVTLLVVDGLSNKEIGHKLNISYNTVKVPLHNIYLKLEIRKRTSLAILVAKLEVWPDRRRTGGITGEPLTRPMDAPWTRCGVA